MSEQVNSAPYFSIKWQTFGFTSLVLLCIFVVFLFSVSESSLKQFESGRRQIYDQHKQQFDNLIEVSAEKMIQLAGATTLNDAFISALFTEDRKRLDAELDKLGWNLQIDAGVEAVSAFNHDGKLVSGIGDRPEMTLVNRVIKTETPQWAVNCTPHCTIQAGTALLYEGRVVGALVLSEPLSNVMLRFQRLANSDAGLLRNIGENNQISHFIPSWDRSLVAMTNPEASRALIGAASEHFSLQELSNGIRLSDRNNQVFELRALPLSDSQMVVISNVSDDFSMMEQTRTEAILISVGLLIGAELILFLLLWRPLSRIRKSALILPLLADRRFQDVRSTLHTLDKKGLFSDETDVLKRSAVSLSREFETLKTDLDQKTGALAKALDFSTLLLDSVDALVLAQDQNGHVQECNKYALKLFGLASQQICGLAFSELLDASGESAVVSRRIDDVVQGVLSEYQHRAAVKDAHGIRHQLVWRHVPFYDDAQSSRKILSIAMPCTTYSSVESELSWLINHDTLTGLLNRQAFEQRLSQTLASVRHHAHRYSLLLLSFYSGDSLLNFKLSKLSPQNRLQCCLDETHHFARISPDVFALIQYCHNDTADFDLACRLCLCLSDDDSKQQDLSIHIGITTIKSDDEKIENILARAESALSQAKPNGQSVGAGYISVNSG